MATRARRPVLSYPRAVAVPRTQSVSRPFRFLGVTGVFFVLVGISLFAYSALDRNSGPGAAAFTAREHVVYAQFGLASDIIYATAAADSSDRQKLLEIPHAREFGIVPSMSPDGRAFVYTVLPPETVAPAPDSPADLWLASLDGAGPALIGRGFDLRVRPVWAPDATRVVARRSGVVLAPGPAPAALGPGSAFSTTDGPYELVLVRLATGAVSPLVSSEDALFPVGFTPDGLAFYYTSISLDGSDLNRLDLASGASVLAAHLSDDISRDWALSPDGGRLAFVTLAQYGARTSSSVHVRDIATGETVTSVLPADEFGPSWSPAGDLTYGRLTGSRSTTAVVVAGGAIAGPARGFDVPLAWSGSGASIAVRTFDGLSVSAPGRATLSVLTPGGARRAIASGEVTFIGWTYR